MAAKLKSKNKELEERNIIQVDQDLGLLRSIGIYGANGSGKSNVIQGLMAMLFVILDSIKDEKAISKRIEPFQLDPEKQKQPSFFQLQFVLDGKKYRYGFEADVNNIVSEWLWGPAEKNETKYFSRLGTEISYNEKYFSEAKDLESKTSTTNLFLNVVNAFNGSVSKNIKLFLISTIDVWGGINDKSFRHKTIENLQYVDRSKEIFRFLNLADSGIDSISPVEESEYGSFATTKVISTRKVFDKDLLRRDQIYFTEKDTKGKTCLYSLYDFKGVRNDAAFEKNYIQGKYGAIPYLGDFNTLFDV